MADSYSKMRALEQGAKKGKQMNCTACLYRYECCHSDDYYVRATLCQTLALAANAKEEERNDEEGQLGWNQTSVNCDTWEKFGYNEANNEFIPYNCLDGEEHYWLFDELNKRN